MSLRCWWSLLCPSVFFHPDVFLDPLQQRTSVVRVGGVGTTFEVKDKARCGRARTNVRHRVTTESSAVVAIDEMVGVVERTRCWRHATRVCSNNTIECALCYEYSTNSSIWCCMFTARRMQRMLAQYSCRNYVCLFVYMSVTCVLCNETKEHTANILILYERAIILVSVIKALGGWHPPVPKICAQRDPPLQKRQL